MSAFGWAFSRSAFSRLPHISIPCRVTICCIDAWPVSCNLHRVDVITGPGTINDLVSDAAAAGHEITTRLIRDWTEHGLLDKPQKRPAGKGHGAPSRPSTPVTSATCC